MNIVPLTSAIYNQLSGEPPISTIKGLAVVDGNDTYALCGTVVMGGENFIIFGSKPGFSKRDIIRGWKAFKPMLSKEKSYYAVIDRELETAKDMLEHFDFIHLHDDVYYYGGQ